MASASSGSQSEGPPELDKSASAEEGRWKRGEAWVGFRSARARRKRDYFRVNGRTLCKQITGAAAKGHDAQLLTAIEETTQ